MELTYECPQCGRVGSVEDLEWATHAPCACGSQRELNPDAIENGQLRKCPWCSTSDLYLQKDFPHGLGLTIILIGFAISTVFWYFYMPVSALLVLLATAALDLVLYYLVPDVTICYRCLAQYRGEGANPDGQYQPFDLAIGERYRQERLRVEQFRQRRASVEPNVSTPSDS